MFVIVVSFADAAIEAAVADLGEGESGMVAEGWGIGPKVGKGGTDGTD